MKIPKPPPKKKKEIVYLDNRNYLVPPNAVDLEDILIGTFIIAYENNFVKEIIKISFSEMFYSEINRIIFQCIKELHNEKEPVDLKTLSNILKIKGLLSFIGGEYHLIQLSQKISSSAHVEFHLRIILQKYILRELIDVSRKTIKNSFLEPTPPDVFDLIDYIKNKLSIIDKKVIFPSSKTKSLNAKEELREKVRNVREGKMPGIYMGGDQFDNWSGGFRKRELITIAARPGMGKTSAGISMITKQSFDYNIKTALFSLEMSNIDITNRVAAKLTRIDYKKINTGNLTEEELIKVEDAFDYIRNSNFSVYDTLEHKNILENIIEKIKDLVSKGVRIVYIDYVQLIKLLKSSDRTADLSIITRELKALANELNIPIIQFAQLNRGIDNRNSKIPLLSDLKQSGSIEEDSDTVIFILRPAYYRQEQGIEIVLPKKVIGETLFIVAKGRNIGVRTFKMFLDFDQYNFVDFEFN